MFGVLILGFRVCGLVLNVYNFRVWDLQCGV